MRGRRLPPPPPPPRGPSLARRPLSPLLSYLSCRFVSAPPLQRPSFSPHARAAAAAATRGVRADVWGRFPSSVAALPLPFHKKIPSYPPPPLKKRQRKYFETHLSPQRRRHTPAPAPWAPRPPAPSLAAHGSTLSTPSKPTLSLGPPPSTPSLRRRRHGGAPLCQHAARSSSIQAPFMAPAGCDEARAPAFLSPAPTTLFPRSSPSCLAYLCLHPYNNNNTTHTHVRRSILYT